MVSHAPAKLLSIEEFERLYAGKRYEYVAGHAVPMGVEEIDERGEVVVVPPKLKHGIVTMEIAGRLRDYLLKKPIGQLLGAETGFVMQKEPLEIRAADVAYVAFERLRTTEESRGWLPFPPDLAVEVVSENDRAAEVRAKAQSYMANGTKLLLVAYPDDRTIDVYRPGQPIRTLGGADTLDGGDVLPGFSTPVKDIFAPLDAVKSEG